MRLKMYRGHYCDAAVQMVQSNVGYGAMTGATPNGRLAGMPISDTMSATQQADTNGPTAAELWQAGLPGLYQRNLAEHVDQPERADAVIGPEIGKEIIL